MKQQKLYANDMVGVSVPNRTYFIYIHHPPETFLSAAMPNSLTISGAVAINYDPYSNPAADKIRGFSKLPDGWHYGSGTAPTQRMIDSAVGWSDALRRFGFTTTDAFPGADGEIMVTAYEGSHYVELLLEVDFTVSLIYERNKREVCSAEHADPLEIYNVLESIAGAIWNTSAFSTQSILTVNSMSSKALHSRIRGTEYRLFKDYASMQAEQQYVNILEDTTTTWVENRPSSGFLMIPSFPRIPA